MLNTGGGHRCRHRPGASFKLTHNGWIRYFGDPVSPPGPGVNRRAVGRGRPPSGLYWAGISYIGCDEKIGPGCLAGSRNRSLVSGSPEPGVLRGARTAGTEQFQARLGGPRLIDETSMRSGPTPSASTSASTTTRSTRRRGAETARRARADRRPRPEHLLWSPHRHRLGRPQLFRRPPSSSPGATRRSNRRPLAPSRPAAAVHARAPPVHPCLGVHHDSVAWLPGRTARGPGPRRAWRLVAAWTWS